MSPFVSSRAGAADMAKALLHAIFMVIEVLIRNFEIKYRAVQK
jgi:hypothetical protein